MSAAVRAVTCPSCGGGTAIRGDRDSGPCGSCGTECVLLDAPAPRRARFVPNLDAAAAVAAARRALESGLVAPRVRSGEDAWLLAPALVYVPFVEFDAIRAGTLVRNRGTRERRGGIVDWSTGERRFLDDQGAEIDERTYYARRDVQVLDTHVVLADHRAVEPAGGPAEWRLSEAGVREMLDDPAFALARLDPAAAAAEGATVLAPTGLAAIREMMRRFAGSAVEDNVEFLAAETRIVFLPVWVVRWRAGPHPHTFVVDAVRGEVLHGTAPEGRRVPDVLAVTGSAAAGLFLAGTFWMVRDEMLFRRGDPADVVAAVIFAAFFVTSILAAAWGEYRYRGHVVFRRAGPEVVRLRRPAQTGIERFLEKWADVWEQWREARRVR